MSKVETFKVNILPSSGIPNAIYFVPNGNSTDVDQFITDISGNYHRVNSVEPVVIASSNSIVSKFQLGETIGGGYLVYEEGGLLYKYNQNDNALFNRAIGFTKTAGVNGEFIDVILSGECNQMGGLTRGIVYYAMNNGLIGSTAPMINTYLPVGVAKNSNTLLVRIGKPYIRI